MSASDTLYFTTFDNKCVMFGDPDGSIQYLIIYKYVLDLIINKTQFQLIYIYGGGGGKTVLTNVVFYKLH